MSATIGGFLGIYARNSVATIVNVGTITGNPTSGFGVVLISGGAVTNQTTGTISGADGIYVAGAVTTVVNAGSVYGGYDAVVVRGGGAVSNQSGGTINGGTWGVKTVGTIASTVTNQGLIVGETRAGVGVASGGTVSNAGSGVIVGGAYGIDAYSNAATIINLGTVTAQVVGVVLFAGGSVNNAASGTILGGSYGVAATNTTATVTNQGRIAGSVHSGVQFRDGGYVSNTGAGTITGDYFGVQIYGASGSVTNFGSIFSTAAYTGVSGFDAAGVDLGDGGTVVNDPSGNIRATWKGVEIGALGAGIGGTLLNQGAIYASNSVGSTGAAVWIHGPGLISNAATGTIAGGPFGIVAYYQTTVMNFGSIGGTEFAFDAVNPGFADRVVVAPGASFSGFVSGGNAIGGSVVSTLELASGASAGTLHGLGSQYVEFASVTIDAGAIWTWDSDAIGAGYAITDAGTLTNTGSLGSSVTLGAGAVLTNASGGTITSTGTASVYGSNGGPSTLVNAGSIGNSQYYGVSFAAGGMVTNASGGTISGYRGGVYITGAPGTVANDGSLAGGQLAGVALDDGGLVTNQGSGTITGYAFGRGVGVYDAAGTVINYGSIAASAGYAVYLDNGGAVTNRISGSITGYAGADGVAIRNAPGMVTNLGLIASIGGSAIYVFNSGQVTNQSSGTVAGGNAGVILGIGGTVVNDGSVSGDNAAYAGIVLKSGGQVTNQSSGTIRGYAGADGVSIRNAAGTVVNAGSISGTTDAVAFAAGFANRLVVDPGAAFTGTVTGGNTIGATAVSTLELASGASAGTLSGLGTQFIDFAQTTIDAGASWTLTGANTIVAGAPLTELSGARLSVTGTLVNDGTIVIDPSTLIAAGLTGTGSVMIDANSTLTVSGSVSAGETIVFAGTNGVLNILDPTGFAGTIQAQGPTDQVNTPRTLVWTGAQTTNFANAFNWDDLTNSANPAATPPGALDTAEFLGTGGIVTGTGTVAVLQFGSSGLWALGSGAALTADTGITVGNGMLAVDGGASIVSEGSVDVIAGTGGLAAAVTVSGTHAAWNSAGNLVVGEAGIGNLAIQGDGTVVSSAGTIANQSSAGGSSVNVTGAGSDWQITGTLQVGAAAEGALNIAFGATVSATTLDAAVQTGSDGVITVAGTGSLLQLTGSLTVGDQGAGELSILGGATVSALDVTIGNASALSSGNVDVEGPGSELLIGTGGLLNIGLAGGGSGVLTVGTGAILNFNGTIVESGHASFNNNGGVVDPDAVEFTTSSNSGAGLNEYSLYVGNIGAVQIDTGTGTWDTPMLLSGTSVADATNNINTNGNGVGTWQLSNGGTLIINANTIDAGQAIVFEDATDTLVIGQVVNAGSAGVSGVNPTIAAGAENLLAAGGFAAEIWNYKAGDQILFDNLIVASDIVSGNTLELFGAGDTLLGSLTFFNHNGAAYSASAMAAPAAQIAAAPCFAAGTRIATERGEVAVEAIGVGERVRVLLGDGLAEVIWVGRRAVDCARHAQPRKVWPVRVAAGAFGAGRPHRDLFLSPDHAVYVGEVLIPVKHLINGSSITQVPVDRVTYHHLELAEHDVLLAEGLPAESFLDMRDGSNYANRAGPVRLYPDFSVRMWEAFGCARLVVTGPELAAARELVACAGAAAALAEAADGNKLRRPARRDHQAAAADRHRSGNGYVRAA
jgi:T5SS/PEP-CTERM-associated repeat protein